MGERFDGKKNGTGRGRGDRRAEACGPEEAGAGGGDWRERGSFQNFPGFGENLEPGFVSVVLERFAVGGPILPGALAMEKRLEEMHSVAETAIFEGDGGGGFPAGGCQKGRVPDGTGGGHGGRQLGSGAEGLQLFAEGRFGDAEELGEGGNNLRGEGFSRIDEAFQQGGFEDGIPGTIGEFFAEAGDEEIQDFIQREIGRGEDRGGGREGSARLAQRDVFGEEDIGRGKDAGAFHRVFQFADIARPGVAFQDACGFFGELEQGAEFAVGDALEEVFREEAYVFLALAQGGEMNPNDVETVEEIFAEFFADDFLLEIFIGGRHNTDVGADGLVAADAGEFGFLKDAQEFALGGEGHFSDFVQKEGAAVALLEASDALTVGAGEGTFFMAEEFALEEILRDGGAVDGEEAVTAALAVVMNGAGDEFLARSALAGDHDGGFAARDASDHFKDLLHRLGLTDDFILMLFDGELGLEGTGALLLGVDFEGCLDDDFEIEGELLFADEIKGTEFHGFDDGLGCSEGTVDDDHGIRGMLADFEEEFLSRVGDEIHLGENEFRFLLAEGAVGGVGRVFRENADAHGFDLVLGPGEKINFAIHEENGGRFGRFFHGLAMGCGAGERPPKRRSREAKSRRAAWKSAWEKSGQSVWVT